MEEEENTGWFSRYLLKGIGYVIKYIFKNALSLVQFLAKNILNYLFGFRFINQYFNINKYILGQIKIVICYIQKKGRNMIHPLAIIQSGIYIIYRF